MHEQTLSNTALCWRSGWAMVELTFEKSSDEGLKNVGLQQLSLSLHPMTKENLTMRNNVGFGLDKSPFGLTLFVEGFDKQNFSAFRCDPKVPYLKAL